MRWMNCYPKGCDRRPGTLNAPEFRGADRTSFEHPARLLCLHGPQWQVDSLVPYCLLPLLAQDEVQEGRNRRVQRLAGGAVDVEIDEAGERIARERDILIVRRIERAVRILRDREGLYGGVDEGQSGVSQCISVLRDASRHRKYQAVKVQVRAPLAASIRGTQYTLPYELLESVPGLHGIDVNGFVRPVTGQTELPPDRDGCPAAMVRAGQERIQLLERNSLQGVILVDEEADRIQKAEVAPGACGHRYAPGCVAEFRLELLDVIGLELA